MNVPAVQAIQNTTVRDYVDELAEKAPDSQFLVDPESGQIITYLEAREQICCIAEGIRRHGLKPGQTVAYAFSNSPQSALCILGILYGGYIATAVNLVSGDDSIGYVLEHSQSALILVDHQSFPTILRLIEGMDRRPKMVDLKNVAVSANTGFSFAPIASEADGLLMYTSGTTGRPKGVVHTQASLLAGGNNTAVAHQLTSSDRGLCVLPLYHINAFCVSLMGSLVSGGTLVLPRKFSASSFWPLIRKFKCSWFSVVPTQISYLLHNADDLRCNANGCSELRFGRSASAPLSPEVHAQFEKRFDIPIIETMGLTETAAQILSNPLPPGTRKIGSPGIAFGNEVIIGDEEQHPLPIGSEGEILVRGPNLLRCYLKNEEATHEAITSDGWLRTGDLGRIDDDGYVYVTGRLKELIIKGGENIAPREIDEALYSHSDVVEAAAFAVECPNYGQKVEAGVRLTEAAQVSAQELLELCKQKIGDFKSPEVIHILPELPKGPSGKIQRIKLAELLKSR